VLAGDRGALQLPYYESFNTGATILLAAFQWGSSVQDSRPATYAPAHHTRRVLLVDGRRRNALAARS
jgi:hypothetical protein